MDWSAFALLVVDAQRDFWTPDRRRRHPQFPANLSALLSFARAEGLRVIHLRAAFAPDRSDWMPRHRLLGKVPCIRGTEGVEALDCAREAPGEPVLEKQTFNGFTQPQLEPLLARSGARFVLIAGLVTSVCVLTTAIGAAERDYLVAVVEDCCADNRANDATLEHYPFALERVNHAELGARHPGWLDQLARLG